MNAATKSAIAAEVARIAATRPEWTARAWSDAAVVNVAYNLQFNSAAVEFAYRAADKIKTSQIVAARPW